MSRSLASGGKTGECELDLPARHSLFWLPVIRCLVLDHDDTAVDSTASIHYPAHLEIMARLRPGVTPVSLNGWFLKNFDPGISRYLEDELGLTGQELAVEMAIWRRFTAARDPDFYPGLIQVLRRFQSTGGVVTVVSHSEAATVRRHYRRAGLTPQAVYGWHEDGSRRKPSPWPVQRILKRFGLRGAEVLVLDDLRPGVEMARAAGVPVAGVGWSHRIPEIESYMRANCDAYFLSVAEFGAYLLGPNGGSPG